MINRHDILSMIPLRMKENSNMDTRVALKDYSHCNSTSPKECIDECPEPICRVRELRVAIKSTPYEPLVERALEEHWFTAYNDAIRADNSAKSSVWSEWRSG